MLLGPLTSNPSIPTLPDMPRLASVTPGGDGLAPVKPRHERHHLLRHLNPEAHAYEPNSRTDLEARTLVGLK